MFAKNECGFSQILQLSEFVWMIRSSVWVVFNNFLLIDATDRSKISSVQKRLFFAVSLYPLSFFADTPFKLFKWKVTWNYVDSQINIYEIACLRFWKEISPSYFLQPSPPIQSRYLWNKYLLKNLNINFNKKIKTSPPFLFFSNLEQKWGCMGIQWEPVLALNFFFSRTFNIFYLWFVSLLFLLIPRVKTVTGPFPLLRVTSLTE